MKSKIIYIAIALLSVSKLATAQQPYNQGNVTINNLNIYKELLKSGI